MVALITVGCTLGLLLFFFLFYKTVDFFMSRHCDKKNREELLTYPEFYRAYGEFHGKINGQEEIKLEIEKEQSIANCFPAGADYDAHIKKIEELRYSYLCKQGAIDIVKMERKELAAKLNAVSLKPKSAEQNYR